MLGLSPAGDVELSAVGRDGRTAALFGTEGPGLPPEVMARVRTVRIPIAAGFDSLNVATASGIVLHQLVGQAPRPQAASGRMRSSRPTPP